MLVTSLGRQLPLCPYSQEHSQDFFSRGPKHPTHFQFHYELITKTWQSGWYPLRQCFLVGFVKSHRSSSWSWLEGSDPWILGPAMPLSLLFRYAIQADSGFGKEASSGDLGTDVPLWDPEAKPRYSGRGLGLSPPVSSDFPRIILYSGNNMTESKTIFGNLT